MISNASRATLWFLAGTLIAAFVLGEWYVSKRAKALREIDLKIADQTKKLHLLESDLQIALTTLMDIRATVRSLSRLATSQPEEVAAMLLRSKRGFTDIQHQVAQGKFAGLALTDGYMELKAVFENSSLGELLERPHRGDASPLRPRR